MLPAVRRSAIGFPFTRPPCLGVVLAFLVVAAAARGATPAPTSWSLHEGDRVVFLGDALVEREGERGAIETALVATHPDADLTFRNLGWSGDTVWAESRGVFDQPSAGYARLLPLVDSLEPAVVVIAYGRNESFGGAGPVPRSTRPPLSRPPRAAAGARPRSPPARPRHPAAVRGDAAALRGHGRRAERRTVPVRCRDP
jgi:hypothetical protein